MKFVVCVILCALFLYPIWLIVTDDNGYKARKQMENEAMKKAMDAMRARSGDGSGKP